MIICEEYTCLHCLGGLCEKSCISIQIKATGEFKSGDRVTYPVCRDYEEEKGGADRKLYLPGSVC